MTRKKNHKKKRFNNKFINKKVNIKPEHQINQLNYKFHNITLRWLELYTEEEVESLLLKKYGPVNDCYMTFSKDGKTCTRNKNLTYPQDNLIIHHIMEKRIANLSRPDVGKLFPKYQQAQYLCYANLLEHVILHTFIGINDPNHTLGFGGLFNFKMLWELWLCKEKFDVSEEDYLTLLTLLFPYAPEGILLLRAQIFGQYRELTLDNNLYFINQIKEKYTIGISQITAEEYNQLNVKQLSVCYKYKTFYVLRSPHDAIMIIAKSNSNQLILFNQGQRHKIPQHSIQWYYDHLDQYQEWCTYIYTNTLERILEPIAAIIQANGGIGHIHGCIIDIDYFHHIKYDLANNCFIPYFAESTKQRDIYPSVVYMMESIQQIPFNTTALTIFCNQFPCLGLIEPIMAQTTCNTDKGFYTGNNNMNNLQNIAKNKLITFWSPMYDENITPTHFLSYSN